jgi:copper transport protein
MASLTRTVRRGTVSAVLAAVFALLLASPVSAHAELVASNPANGARLESPPQTVTMTFTESVSLVDGSVHLVNDAGATVPTDDPSVAGHTVTSPMPADLPDGSYTVIWRVVSSDGHPVAGAFSFGIGTTPQQVAGSSAGTSGSAPWPVVGAQFVGYLAFALLLGVVGWLLWCAPTSGSDPRLRLLVRTGLLAGLATTAATVLVRGPWVAGGSWGTMLDPAVIRESVGTPAGTAMLWRLVLYGALTFGLWTSRWLEPLLGRWLVCAGLVATAVTFGLAGHGAASGSAVDVAVDAVHALAAGTWVGGLVVLVAVGRSVEPRSVHQFSGLATTSVVLLVASGLYNSVRHLEGLNALWVSRYGQILILKVLLVGVALLAASVSRRRLRERRSLRRSVRIEAVGTTLVLALTAVLALTSPSVPGATLADLAGHRHAAGVGDVAVIVPLTDGRAAQVQVAPPHTTGSLIRVQLLDSQRRPMSVQRVDLKVSLPARGIPGIRVPLQPNSDSSIWVGNCSFPFPGTWTMAVTVEDRSLSAVVATGTVEIIDH